MFERTLSFRVDAEGEYLLKELMKETKLGQSAILRLGLAEMLKKSKNGELRNYGQFIEADAIRSKNRRKIRGLTWLKNVRSLLVSLKKQGFSSAELLELKDDLVHEAEVYDKVKPFLKIFKYEVEHDKKLKLKSIKVKKK